MKLHVRAVGRGPWPCVLHPWHDPLPLKRCWCLYEAFTCLKSKGWLTIGMAERDSHEFYEALKTAETKSHLTSLVTKLNARNASATVARDAKMIHEKIESSLGFDAFNGVLHEALLGWLRRAAFQRFSSSFCSYDGVVDAMPMPVELV